MTNDNLLKVSIAGFVMVLLAIVITVMLFVPIPAANNTILTTMLTLIVRDFGNIVRSIYKLVTKEDDPTTETPAKTE